VTVPEVADRAAMPSQEARVLLDELYQAGLLQQGHPGRYGWHRLVHAFAAELHDILDGEASPLKRSSLPMSRPRREEYPELTRRAVVEAARQLFAERGFFQVKVDEIAAASRVSPATVYAQCGGKRGLLPSLMDTWTTDIQIGEVEQDILAIDDPAMILRTLAQGYRFMHEKWSDVITIVVDVAPHDEEAAAILATAQQRHRRSLAKICRHLADLDGLRDGIDASTAARLITYFYGIDGLVRAQRILGWPIVRTNEWLLTETSAAVCAGRPVSRPHPRYPRSPTSSTANLAAPLPPPLSPRPAAGSGSGWRRRPGYGAALGRALPDRWPVLPAAAGRTGTVRIG
jgi:AcrR family transcriptional regulator